MPDTARSRAQSTLLDGRVMVSGGENGVHLNSAYIYTPSNNSWFEAASMSNTFYYHGQSSLIDGKVLVTGGWSVSQLNSYYIYTPSGTAKGSWSNISTLPAAFERHGHSTLNDGRVLISGGFNSRNNVYMYTPSGTWAPVSSLSVGLNDHRQSTLMDGKVLVSGGSKGNDVPYYNTVYVYAPNASSGSWYEVKSMPVSVRMHGQSTLADGRVLISGGQDTNGTLNTAYIYTPAGWVAVGKLYFIIS